MYTEVFLNASLASVTVSSIPSGITITCILVDSFVCTLTVYTRVAGTFINICKKKTSIPNSNCNTNMIIPIHIVWTWIKTSPIMVLCSYMYLLSDHFKGCWNTHQYLRNKCSIQLWLLKSSEDFLSATLIISMKLLKILLKYPSISARGKAYFEETPFWI